MLCNRCIDNQACFIDVVIKQESCNAVAVNIQEGEDDSSTDGVLQAVKVNEKHTLSLGGKEVICHNSKLNIQLVNNPLTAGPSDELYCRSN